MATALLTETTIRPAGWCYQCARETSIDRHNIRSTEHFSPEPLPFRSVMYSALNVGAESLGMDPADFAMAVVREFRR
jgi:hypothetical protein